MYIHRTIRGLAVVVQTSNVCLSVANLPCRMRFTLVNDVKADPCFILIDKLIVAVVPCDKDMYCLHFTLGHIY